MPSWQANVLARFPIGHLARSSAGPNLPLLMLKPFFALALGATSVLAQAPYIQQIDAPNAQTPSNATSFSASISANGEWILFMSAATNLVPNTVFAPSLLAPKPNLFIKHVRTGAVTQVNVDSAGNAIDLYGNGSFPLRMPVMSGDAGEVVFLARSDVALLGDQNLQPDLYLYDRAAGQLEWITHDQPFAASYDDVGAPSISGDGRHVVFAGQMTSVAVNQDLWDSIRSYDRQLGTTEELVGSITPAELSFGANPVLAANGQTLAYFQKGLFFEQTGTLTVLDLATGLSRELPAAFSAHTDRVFSLSADGQRIALPQGAFAQAVVVVDLANQSSTCVTECLPAGGALIFGAPSLSPDGRYVAFSAHGSGLAPWLQPETSNQSRHTYVLDLETGLYTLESISDAGVQAMHPSPPQQSRIESTHVLSQGGDRILFHSNGLNLALPVPSALDISAKSLRLFLRERRSLGAEPSLSSYVAGQPTTLDVSGASPNGMVLIGLSSAGQGPTPTPFGLINLTGPWTTVTLFSDANGFASVGFTLPAALAGAEVFGQGLDMQTLYPTKTLRGFVQ